MKIKLKGFRGFSAGGVEVDVAQLTVLTGKNSSGKSTVLRVMELLRGFEFKLGASFDKSFDLGSEAYGGAVAFLSEDETAEVSITFLPYDNFYMDRLATKVTFSRQSYQLYIKCIEVLDRNSDEEVIFVTTGSSYCLFMDRFNKLYNRFANIYNYLGDTYYDARRAADEVLSDTILHQIGSSAGLGDIDAQHWRDQIIGRDWIYAFTEAATDTPWGFPNGLSKEVIAGTTPFPHLPLAKPTTLSREDFFREGGLGDQLFEQFGQPYPAEHKPYVRSACRWVSYYCHSLYAYGTTYASYKEDIIQFELSIIEFLSDTLPGPQPLPHIVSSLAQLFIRTNRYREIPSSDWLTKFGDEETWTSQRDFAFQTYGFSKNNFYVVSDVFSWINKINYHSPKSDSARRTYSLYDTGSAISSFVKQLATLSEEETHRIVAILNEHFNVLGIPSSIRVDVSDKAGIATVYLRNGDVTTTLADEGVGTSAVVSVVLFVTHVLLDKLRQSWKGFNYMGRDTRQVLDRAFTVLEEPETGLHPSLQSRLADYLVWLGKEYNCAFVVETHSEYLIRKLQLLVAREEILSSKVALNYFQNDADKGKSITAYQIHIDEHGILDREFGAGFLDEADNLAVELFNITRQKLN